MFFELVVLMLYWYTAKNIFSTNCFNVNLRIQYTHEKTSHGIMTSFLLQVEFHVVFHILSSSRTMKATLKLFVSTKYVHHTESGWLATPKRWRFVRGYDKPRLMRVAIAIDPFQVVWFPRVQRLAFLAEFQCNSYPTQCLQGKARTHSQVLTAKKNILKKS